MRTNHMDLLGAARLAIEENDWQRSPQQKAPQLLNGIQN